MSSKGILIAVIVALTSVCAPLAAENMDLIVMVDTSTSMFPYFDDLMRFLIQDLLTAKLHGGDTFHLLSFNSTPEEEISIAMGSEEAAQKAFGRLLLLQPFGRYTDLIAALQFLSRYTRGLPDTDPKTVILVTDGVHDPPPDSPNRGSPDRVRQTVENLCASMKREGWTFHILKVPAAPAPGEEGLPSYLSDIARVLEVPILPYKSEDKELVTGKLMGLPTLTFPNDLGRVGRRFNAPFLVSNYGSEAIIVRLSSVLSDGEELLERPVSATVPAGAERTLNVPINLPPSFISGAYEKRIRLTFKDDIRISPSEGTLSFTFTGQRGLVFQWSYLLYVLYAVVGAGVIYLLVRLILYMRKKLHELPQTQGSHAVSHPPAQEPEPRTAKAMPHPSRGARIALLDVGAHTPHTPSRAAPLPQLKRPSMESLRRALPKDRVPSGLQPPVEMRVSFQNSHVGFRNIHRIPKGSSRTVGGGFSSFLIFLVPVPRGIAEIKNEGGTYIFTPLRQEYFPTLFGPIEDCLDAEIPLTTPRGASFTIKFRQWVSPLEEINALMRSIKHETD
jgi:hypothetical protein